MCNKTKYDRVIKKGKKNRRLRFRLNAYNYGQRRCACCCVQMTWETESEIDITTHRTATLEHLVPASKGGGYQVKNILITCKKCNNSRGTEDWIHFVERNQFPKKEWLIQKYLESVDMYEKGKYTQYDKDFILVTRIIENKNPIDQDIFDNVNEYLAKKAA